MSRGIGRLQRQVLAALEAAGKQQTAAQLAAALWPDGWTRPQEVSLRRAMHGLAERGLAWVSEAHLRPHLQLAAGLPGHECGCERWNQFAVRHGFNPTKPRDRWRSCTKCRASLATDPQNVRLFSQGTRFAKRCLPGNSTRQATYSEGVTP